MAKHLDRKEQRRAIHRRIRRKLKGTAERPRLAFFKSARYVYGQVIDDNSGRTLVSASSLEKGELPRSGSVEAARALGAALAERALQKDIRVVVFDRGGFLYHGAAKAFADAAREKGLTF